MCRRNTIQPDGSEEVGHLLKIASGGALVNDVQCLPISYTTGPGTATWVLHHRKLKRMPILRGIMTNTPLK